MHIVYAGEDMPEKVTKSIFLAGPTPRNRAEVESWRPDALQILNDIGYDGVVFVPELREAKAGHDYDTQVEWEEKYLNVADCIVFWVARDLAPDTNNVPRMPALVTNVEWGNWCDSGKVVLGCPVDADKVGYLKYYANKYNVPTALTLTATLRNAIDLIGAGAEREHGARYVPFFLWKQPSFQVWYQAQTKAGNRLEDAQVLYTFRPGFKNFLFLWVLKVNVWVESEQRFKSNEFVLSRPDISSILLYHASDSVQGSCLEYEVVIVKEFRSPSSSEDGFVRELPGGSSFKPGEDPLQIASEEVHEETGFEIDPSRFKLVTNRQLAATLSAHQSHLFKAEVNADEIEWFKNQKGIVHGNIADSEMTFIEVHTVYDLINNKELGLDWTTLGQILSALAY